MSHINSLPSEARTVLDQLRSRIRSYVLWEGLALVVVVVAAFFWSSFAFDWVYFQVSHLELPRWFRAAVLIAGVGLVTAGAFSWIGLRLFRGFRAKALALVLERRFPELDDRLVTAVEAAEGFEETQTPISAAMLQRTLIDVAEATKRLELSSVFDSQPLRRASIVAVGLVASILGLMVVDSAAMERWVAGYLSLRDGYWPRATELIVKVVVQPGDQLRDFTGGTYRHPKGGDLTLHIEVPHGKKSPDRIRLDSRMGRGVTQVWLTPSADQIFRHTFVGLIESTRLWVSGGDYSHSQPYSVEVVPPPEVMQVTLNSIYPEYTGLNRLTSDGIERTSNELKGAQVSLPLQTDFELKIAANKPLRHARLEGDAGVDRWEIELTTDTSGTFLATIVLKSQDGKPQLQVPIPPPPQGTSGSYWSQDKTTLTLPFVLAADGSEKLPALLRNAAATGHSLELPLPLPPDGLLRITLEDVDQIVSPTPTRFTINGIVDQPPIVETKLKGIGTSITRKARIPVAGTVIDDYGVASAQFDFKVDDASNWQTRNLAVPPRDGPREFTLKRADNEMFERFDVLSLDLSIKQRLTLTLSALDGCTVASFPVTAKNPEANSEDASKVTPVTAAHRSQGVKFAFTIIPEEELLSMLYGRELNLRKRVEQIINESKGTFKELQTQQEKLVDSARRTSQANSNDSELARTMSLGLNAAADRSLHGVRKNAIETAGVESAFAEIREELINNGAETPAMLERLDERILAPLNNINSKNFPSVDGALGLFKLSLDKSTDPTVPLETSINEITALIERLEQVLGEMAEMARFDAVVEDLKKTIKAEMELLEETKRKRKEKAIRALE